jgi:murein DD-endopeptidase MepM/ murein hydrolase activator NlpD
MIQFKSDPVKNPKITCKYGPRTHPVTKQPNFHNGLDLSTPIGTPCLAVTDGKVVKSAVNRGGEKVGFGYFIVVEHDGFCTLYAHLKKLGLPVGTKVKAGQTIAYTGTTGASTGPHLHFEVRQGKFESTFFTTIDGKYPNSIDAEPFLSANEKEYIKILRESGADVEKWASVIDEFKNHKTLKYLPDLILKLNTSK